MAKGVSTGPTSLSGTDRLSLYVLLDTLLVLEAALSIAGIDNQGSTWDSSSGTSAGAGVEADADDAGSGGSRRGVDGAGGGEEPLVADGVEEQPPSATKCAPAVVAAAHERAGAVIR